MSKKFERVLAYHCGLALKGVKTANLISVSLSEFPDILDIVEELKLTFKNKRFKILKISKSHLLLLVYNPRMLYETLFSEKVYEFLLSYNYPLKKNISSYLEELAHRIQDNSTFPHEIGIFLGYDFDDVVLFSLGKKKCLYTGYWKVYRNKKMKLQTFKMFTEVRENLLDSINKGYALYDLV